MYAIAGLGNPDSKYAHTRHNIGFDVIDKLSEKYGISVSANKFRSLCGKGIIEGQSVILAKPLTYMNLSGEAIRELIGFYHLDPASELIVICDDINLSVGQLRIRERGSAGGHNGLKSIISNLGGSNDFIRIRVGVGGKPEHYDLADYVLGRFGDEDKAAMERAKEQAADAAVDLLTMDTGDVMSRYNKRKKHESTTDEAGSEC